MKLVQKFVSEKHEGAELTPLLLQKVTSVNPEPLFTRRNNDMSNSTGAEHWNFTPNEMNRPFGFVSSVGAGWDGALQVAAGICGAALDVPANATLVEQVSPR